MAALTVQRSASYTRLVSARCELLHAFLAWLREDHPGDADALGEAVGTGNAMSNLAQLSTWVGRLRR